MSTTAIKLRTARSRASMTVTELAKRAGVSATTVVNIEADRVTPHGPTLGRLAEALQIDVTELLGSPPMEAAQQNNPDAVVSPDSNETTPQRRRKPTKHAARG